MDGKNQPKTKAELLKELQSIQSLLDEQEHFPALDDDDIPLLDEFLDQDEPVAAAQEQQADLLLDDDIPTVDDALDDALSADTLDALNQAYADLTGEFELTEAAHETSGPTKAQQPRQQDQSAARPDASPHPAKAELAGDPAGADAEPVSNAAGTGTAPELSGAAADLHDPIFTDGPDHEHAGPDSLHTDPAAPKPLPGQQSLFEPREAGSRLHKAGPNQKAGQGLKLERPVLPKKPVGENPFLPQHIRQRLRGNQPLPVGMPPPYPSYQAETEALERSQQHENQALIDSLVAEFMPKIETRLRERLAQQIQLIQQPPEEH